MGNSISFKANGGSYMALVKEKNINRIRFLSIFELGDLNKIKESYQSLQKPVKIDIYEESTNKKVSIPSYKNLKKRDIVFIIKSNDKDITKDIAKKICKLTKWDIGKKESMEKFRPRVVLKCTKNMYEHIKGRHGNGVMRLAHTEKSANAKIIYLQKQKLLIISSDDNTANERILKKIKIYKNYIKNKY